MAQDYIAIKDSDNGKVALNTNVFSSIVKICVEENPNVNLEGQGPFKNDINTSVEDNQLKISFSINVKYNVNVQDECAKLQHQIYDNIKHMCEIDVKEIDIKVSGFDF